MPIAIGNLGLLFLLSGRKLCWSVGGVSLERVCAVSSALRGCFPPLAKLVFRSVSIVGSVWFFLVGLPEATERDFGQLYLMSELEMCWALSSSGIELCLHGLAALVLSASNSAQLAQQNLLPYCVLYSVQLHGLVKGNADKASPSYTKRDSLI